MDTDDGQSDAPPRDPPDPLGSASGIWEGYSGIAARAAGHGRPRTAARKCGGTTSNGGIALSGSARSGCSGVGTMISPCTSPRCAADGVSRPQSFAAPQRWTESPSSMNSPTAWGGFWQTVDDLVVWASAETRAELPGLCCRIACHSWAPAFRRRAALAGVDLWFACCARRFRSAVPLLTLLALSDWAVRKRASDGTRYAQTGRCAPMHGIAALQTARCALSVNEMSGGNMAQARYRRRASYAILGDVRERLRLLGALQIRAATGRALSRAFCSRFPRQARRHPPARRDGALGSPPQPRARGLTVGDERDPHLQQADRYAVATFRAHREDQPDPARCWSGSRGMD